MRDHHRSSEAVGQLAEGGWSELSRLARSNTTIDTSKVGNTISRIRETHFCRFHSSATPSSVDLKRCTAAQSVCLLVRWLHERACSVFKCPRLMPIYLHTASIVWIDKERQPYVRPKCLCRRLPTVSHVDKWRQLAASRVLWIREDIRGLAAERP